MSRELLQDDTVYFRGGTYFDRPTREILRIVCRCLSVLVAARLALFFGSKGCFANFSCQFRDAILKKIPVRCSDHRVGPPCFDSSSIFFKPPGPTLNNILPSLRLRNILGTDVTWSHRVSANISSQPLQGDTLTGTTE